MAEIWKVLISSIVCIDLEEESKKEVTNNLLHEMKEIEKKKCTEVVLSGNSLEEVIESVAKKVSDEKIGKEYGITV